MSPAARKSVAAECKGEVFDYFAWGELGCIGWECTEHQGYHINSDVFVVEIQKDGRPANPGEEGEVVCTSLHSTAMPLIRYATGDLAVQAAEPCPCGCGLPLMGERRGRANTFIIKTDGTWVSPCLLVNRLKVIPGIGQYKLLQLEKGKLDVRLMPAKGFGPEIQEKVLLVLKESLGKDMTVHIHIVDAIEPDPPGGIYSIHSDVSTEEQYFG
jgi:phenylacetate-CoA ligase